MKSRRKNEFRNNQNVRFLTKGANYCIITVIYAGMVELADTQDLGSCALGVQVRPLLPAPETAALFTGNAAVFIIPSVPGEKLHRIFPR